MDSKEKEERMAKIKNQSEILFKIYDLWDDNTRNKEYEEFAIGAKNFMDDLIELHTELLNMLSELEDNTYEKN